MPMPFLRSACRALSPLLLVACSNYDFADARKTDGEWDLARLAADLEKSGEDSLRQGSWFPLIHLDVITFRRSDPRMPPGYTLQQFDANGPVFFAGASERRVFDERFEPVEGETRDWFGWGLLYWDRSQTIETTHGRRHDGADRVLLLFGGDSTHYFETRTDR